MPTAIITNARLASGATAAMLCLSLVAAAEPMGRLPGGRQHRILSADQPPGMVGQARLAGRGAVAGYFQPVAVVGPPGAKFALPIGSAMSDASPLLTAGLLVGGVYRFQITEIPGAEGAELFPTIEVIDRTYPPPGLATRFPIQIVLDQEDFDAAINGQLVTRVIYLEDPQTATPQVQTTDTNRPLEISEDQDALEVADALGRPVAIVRIGSLAPPSSPALLPEFFFGYPVWAPIVYPESDSPVASSSSVLSSSVPTSSEPSIQP
jgi:hypothetical protein